MAFKDASTEYKCGRTDCNNMRKYFRMMESRRERDAFIDPGAGDDYEDIKRYKRICEVCEKQPREEEFPTFPARWRELYPNYCTDATINKTIRAKAKGNTNQQFAKDVKKSKQYITERKARGEHLHESFA